MWDQVEGLETLHSFQRNIRDFLDNYWYSKNRLEIICPNHSERYKIISDYILKKREPVLIFTPDLEGQDKWLSSFSELLPPNLLENERREFIGSPNLIDELPQISLLRYSALSTPVITDVEEKFVAREKCENFMASLDIHHQEITDIGAIDGISDASRWLDSIAVRKVSLYQEGLEPFLAPVKLDEAFDPDLWLSHNVEQYIERFKELGIKTIICSSSNRVTGLWAEMLNYLAKRLGDPHIIGITSYPISLNDLSPRDYELHQALFGGAQATIPTPLLVQDGCLAPYRDLLYLVEPTDREVLTMKEILRDFEEQLTHIEDPEKVSLTLRDFVLHELETMERDAPGNWARREKMMRSCLQYCVKNKIKLPGIWTPFLNKIGPYSFQDILEAVLEFINLRLLETGDQNDARMANALQRSLKAIGYIFSEHHVQESISLLPNIMKRSHNKLNAMISALELEMDSMQDDLRALVITDFLEFSIAYDYFPNTETDYSSCGAFSVFEAMHKSAATAQLNPIIIDGYKIYINHKIEPFVMKELERWQSLYHNFLKFSQERFDNHTCIEVTGPVIDQKTWATILMGLLEKKVTYCFIATRSFLSDGWDAIKVNTLFNLSTVESIAAEDKLKQRLLTLDEVTDRARHSWDFVAICNDIVHGMSDFQRVVRKKRGSCSLCEDGIFEFGISHIYPLHSSRRSISSEDLEQVNEENKKLVPLRRETLEQWRSNRLSDNEVSFAYDCSFPKEVLDQVIKLQVVQNKQLVEVECSMEDFYRRLFHAVYEAYCICQDIPADPNGYQLTFSRRHPCCWRLFIKLPSEIKEKLEAAFLELLMPLSHQHYVIAAKINGNNKSKGFLSKLTAKKNKEEKVIFAIPSCFATQDKLKKFALSWQKYIGPDLPQSFRLPEIRDTVLKDAAGTGQNYKASLVLKKIWTS